MTRAANDRVRMADPSRGPHTPPGVLLVAHGSARSGDSAEPVLALAAALRARGFPEVGCAFWKEEPFLHQALDTLGSATVAVLPIFLAEGYFTRTVVPRELGLSPGANRRYGRMVYLLAPIGVHPRMADIVAERAHEAVPSRETQREALLVVLGHGTPRDPGSAAAVRDVAATLGRSGGFARVEPAFIDQSPRVEDLVAEAPETRVIVVPFLVSAGWHGGTTVPRDLGLDDTGRDPAGRIVYAEPIGTYPGLAALAATAITEAALPSGAEATDALTPSHLERAEARLADRLERERSARLLQVRVVKRPDGRYELRHVDDESAEPAALREMDPASLLLHGRIGVDGGHRPLRTGADLRSGWYAVAADPHSLMEALVALYGAAPIHWALANELEPASFRTTAGRQSGMYARLERAEPPAVAAGIERCCDGIPCLRRRLWTLDATTAIPTSGEELVVPCPSPCPVLLSAVLAIDQADPETDRTSDSKPA